MGLGLRFILRQFGHFSKFWRKQNEGEGEQGKGEGEQGEVDGGKGEQGSVVTWASKGE